MKKIIALILVVSICLCMAACGSGKALDGDGIGPFTTYDLDGNEVTESIFADKDVTVLHIWGTYCVPCKEEMPELVAFANELPDNAQLVAVLNDVDSLDADTYKDAVQILQDNGADFTCLLGADALGDFIHRFNVAPVTLLVDSEGKIIGDAIRGAGVDRYKEALDEYFGN